MQYRVTKELHTDRHPNEKPFTGQVLTETPDSGFLLAGARAVIDEADAQRWGLIGTDLIEPYDPEQAAKDREAAAIATHGSQERAQAGVVVEVPVSVPVAPEPVVEPQAPSVTPSDAGAHTGPVVSDPVVLEATKPSEENKAEKPAHKKPGPKPKH